MPRSPRLPILNQQCEILRYRYFLIIKTPLQINSEISSKEEIFIIYIASTQTPTPHSNLPLRYYKSPHAQARNCGCERQSCATQYCCLEAVVAITPGQLCAAICFQCSAYRYQMAASIAESSGNKKVNYYCPQY
jgi:hypothetical protein